MTFEQATELVGRAFGEVLPNVQVDLSTTNAESEIQALGLDSAQSLELAGFLEERLGCEFSEYELARVRTLRDLIALVVASDK